MPPEAFGDVIVGLVDYWPSQMARALCERGSSTYEDPGALARSIAQDPRHGQRGVVIEDRARNTAEESEGRTMAITEGLADLRRLCL